MKPEIPDLNCLREQSRTRKQWNNKQVIRGFRYAPPTLSPLRSMPLPWTPPSLCFWDSPKGISLRNQVSTKAGEACGQQLLLLLLLPQHDCTNQTPPPPPTNSRVSLQSSPLHPPEPLQDRPQANGGLWQSGRVSPLSPRSQQPPSRAAWATVQCKVLEKWFLPLPPLAPCSDTNSRKSGAGGRSSDGSLFPSNDWGFVTASGRMGLPLLLPRILVSQGILRRRREGAGPGMELREAHHKQGISWRPLCSFKICMNVAFYSMTHLCLLTTFKMSPNLSCRFTFLSRMTQIPRGPHSAVEKEFSRWEQFFSWRILSLSHVDVCQLTLQVARQVLPCLNIPTQNQEAPLLSKLHVSTRESWGPGR